MRGYLRIVDAQTGGGRAGVCEQQLPRGVSAARGTGADGGSERATGAGGLLRAVLHRGGSRRGEDGE